MKKFSANSDINDAISKLVKQLEAECLEYFQDTSLDHEFSKYLEDYYCYVDAEILPSWYDTGDDMVRVEVRAELDYDSFLDLIERIDDIVVKYDEYAYFDMESPGIATCGIPADRLF